MEKPKYKAGDKVTVKENFWVIESGIHFYSGMKKLAGRTLEVDGIYSSGNVDTKQDDSNDNTRWYWDENWLEPNKEITWETLKWKDVVVDKTGEEQMVLLIANDLVFLSSCDEFNGAEDWYHKQELQNDGYIIKQINVVKQVVEPKETIEVGGYTYKLVK